VHDRTGPRNRSAIALKRQRLLLVPWVGCRGGSEGEVPASRASNRGRLIKGLGFRSGGFCLATGGKETSRGGEVVGVGGVKGKEERDQRASFRFVG
jgi:hypothetical protein